MSDLSPTSSLVSAPAGFLTPAPTAPAAGTGSTISDARRAQIKKTAEDFEASFLSEMLKPMFEGLSTDGPFGGGEAEATWRSFMIDAMAKQTVKAGGIGLSGSIMSEMLKMQEARQ